MRWWLLGLLILLSANASAAEVDPNDFGEAKSITVLASSSMTVSLAEIAKLYSQQNNIDVNTVYEATPELLEKIKAGDPADIVITPNRKYLEEMKAEGLIEPASIKYLVSNNLSLVAAKQFKIQKASDIKTTLSNIRNKTLMIIGNTEDTSLGNYTKQALQNLGLWQSFEKFTVPAPTSAKAVDLIIKSEGAGIIFSNDLVLYGDRLNNLGELPQASHEKIEYFGAVVVSDNMDKARSFLKFLSGKRAQNIFKSDGFIIK